MSSRHIISCLMEDAVGALARLVGLVVARGYNIESLNAAPTEDSTIFRLTMVVNADDAAIERLVKHLNRLVDVVKVVELTAGSLAERELMLVKVRAVGKDRDEMMRLSEIFRGRIIDVNERCYTIELTGDQGKLDAFLSAIGKDQILETVRSGTLGIGRGDRVLRF